MERAINNYYEIIKDDVGIEKAMHSSGTDEESSSAMKNLRPKNLSSF